MHTYKPLAVLTSYNPDHGSISDENLAKVSGLLERLEVLAMR